MVSKGVFMYNKKSKFLLKIIMFVCIFSCIKTFCMDELSFFKDICIEKINEVSTFCYDTYGALDAEKVFLGLGVFGVGAVIPTSYYVGKTTSSHQVITGSLVVTNATLMASFIRGLYNIRAHNAILQDIQARYQLNSVNSWYQLPGCYAVKLICYGSDIETEVISPCMQAVQLKVEKIDDATIFDFTKFIDYFPHIDLENNYCIAKKYFNNFGCITLSDLQSNIGDSIIILEQDFKNLLKLTNVSYAYKMPVTLQDYNNFSLLVHQGQQYIMANLCLGAFGYSPLHNCDIVKNYIIKIVKYHAYLVHLQEILSTCSDALGTRFDEPGNLNFTLQHVNNTVEIK